MIMKREKLMLTASSLAIIIGASLKVIFDTDRLRYVMLISALFFLYAVVALIYRNLIRH